MEGMRTTEFENSLSRSSRWNSRIIEICMDAVLDDPDRVILLQMKVPANLHQNKRDESGTRKSSHQGMAGLTLLRTLGGIYSPDEAFFEKLLLDPLARLIWKAERTDKCRPSICGAGRE